ncbi:hypothetical protein P152DRAFT_247795 [Eremomyces bilateralis CBS 781.70]|uniref:Uncharacterized protein n=1 Tax=Eremomyces bilateralis CBS 781.70 TaxID=1392243 RepID=A0A6G1GB77_9PEZI|nr:uncharacterized protein P152DRAFT_247795 [Eremomyces bilateralis CBS 781.70]KAF1815160.1 hypothetical protein P152DRAFT_247795 [Eremomyces bilateralis CBS 781.70]
MATGVDFPNHFDTWGGLGQTMSSKVIKLIHSTTSGVALIDLYSQHRLDDSHSVCAVRGDAASTLPSLVLVYSQRLMTTTWLAISPFKTSDARSKFKQQEGYESESGRRLDERVACDGEKEIKIIACPGSFVALSVTRRDRQSVSREILGPLFVLSRCPRQSVCDPILDSWWGSGSDA